MRYSNFWLFLDHLSDTQYQIEFIGEQAFLIRLFQEVQENTQAALTLYTIENVLDDPYLWSQNTLFDDPNQQTGAIVLYGKVHAKDQQKILKRIPAQRSCIILSEKKSFSSIETCYYRPPTLQQWLYWSEALTGKKPAITFFEDVAHNPWVLFEQWQQLRLLGEIFLGASQSGLSTDGWKKFSELRRSPQQLGLLLQPQDWHQILYCCEMIHQRCLSTSSDGFYIPWNAVNPQLFESSKHRTLVNNHLLEPYQQMLHASMKHDSDGFIFHLSRFFALERLILEGHITHESAASSEGPRPGTLVAQ